MLTFKLEGGVSVILTKPEGPNVMVGVILLFIEKREREKVVVATPKTETSPNT